MSPDVPWMEINGVTLHKLMKTMPRRMCTVIKAKSGQKNTLCLTFFGLGSVRFQLGKSYYHTLEVKIRWASTQNIESHQKLQYGQVQYSNCRS